MTDHIYLVLISAGLLVLLLVYYYGRGSESFDNTDANIFETQVMREPLSNLNYKPPYDDLYTYDAKPNRVDGSLAEQGAIERTGVPYRPGIVPTRTTDISFMASDPI